MRKVLSLVIVIMSAMVSGSAQTQQDPKRSLENRHVNSKVDVPATRDTDEGASYIRQTSYSYPADDFKPGVVQVGPRITYLKEGLSTDEVVRLLGKPSAITERNEQDVVLTVYEFPRSEGRVLIAEFVKDVLVRFTMETPGQVAKADR
jgi:outer membrane protein assembly factor BamE (lipoprotein component of BamABCDE complex)